MSALPKGNHISTPFNFKHEIHVNARYTGFPAAWRYYGLPDGWAAALQDQPSPTQSQDIRPRRSFLSCLKNPSPYRRWKNLWTSWTVQLYPHPEEDENISLPFNVKVPPTPTCDTITDVVVDAQHEVHANSRHTASWHVALVLAAEESWQTTLRCHGQRSITAKRRRSRFPTFSFSRPLWRKIRQDTEIPSSWIRDAQTQPPPPYPEPKQIFLKIRFADVDLGPYRSTFIVQTGMSFRQVLKLVCQRRKLDPRSYALILDFGDQKGCFKVPLDQTTVTPSDNFRELTLMRQYC